MRIREFFAFVLIVVGASPAWAQPSPDPFHVEPRVVDSGRHRGQLEEFTSTFSVVIDSPGAVWMRLHFSDHNLGARSYLTITSLLDGDQQYLDARYMVPWENSTAIFNGDAVEVELYAAPGEQGIYFQLGSITVGEQQSGGPESQCGPNDDRVDSNDPRVGRIMPVGCTGWIVSNGAHLSAGHCTGGTFSLLHFNVPDSTCNGTTIPAAVNDQYPITAVVSRNSSIGDDFAVFTCGPNSNTGLLPVQAQNAFFRMSRDDAPANVRVTGYGVDFVPVGCGPGNRNSDSQTEQTHWAPYLGETWQGPGDIVISYLVDTEQANSGSPVIILNTTTTLGIHTNGGCSPPYFGNRGTGFENNNLEDAIAEWPGSDVCYADVGHPHVALWGDGTVMRPFETVWEAVNEVPSGGIVSIVKGSYTADSGHAFTIGADGTAMTLVAPVGTVIIGN